MPKAELTPDIQDMLIAGLTAGHNCSAICRYMHIDERVVSGWKTRGDKDNSGLYHRFAVAYDKAIGDSEIKLLKRIKDAGAKDWRALAWIMERRWPERWGKNRAEAPDENKATGASLTLIFNKGEVKKGEIPSNWSKGNEIVDIKYRAARKEISSDTDDDPTTTDDVADKSKPI